jgi:hypothetical protein
MTTTHPVLDNTRLAILRSIVSVPRVRSRRLLNTIVKQYCSILLHGGMIEKIPQFFATTDKGMQDLIVVATY